MFVVVYASAKPKESKISKRQTVSVMYRLIICENPYLMLTRRDAGRRYSAAARWECMTY